MEICACENADVQRHSSGNKFCGRCGHWWMPEHGSLRPGERRQPMVVKKAGRNDLCPCGSGIKLKRCCQQAVLEIKELRSQRPSAGVITFLERIHRGSSL